jgi:hypothetical protein
MATLNVSGITASVGQQAPASSGHHDKTVLTPERQAIHLNVNVEITELIEVISDVIKGGDERITLLLGLLHRLSALNTLLYALVHSGDEFVREAIASAHRPEHVEFVGGATA